MDRFESTRDAEKNERREQQIFAPVKRADEETMCNVIIELSTAVEHSSDVRVQTRKGCHLSNSQGVHNVATLFISEQADDKQVSSDPTRAGGAACSRGASTTKV